MKTSQHQFEDVLDLHFDAIVAASGYERRCTFQARKLRSDAARKIVLGFDKDLESENRKINDKTFKDLGYKIFRKDGQKIDLDFFTKLISDIVSNSKESEVNIYVDYSSMTRNWYAQILFVANQIVTNKSINIYFGYSFAKYEKSSREESLNRVVEPI